MDAKVPHARRMGEEEATMKLWMTHDLRFFGIGGGLVGKDGDDGL